MANPHDEEKEYLERKTKIEVIGKKQLPNKELLYLRRYYLPENGIEGLNKPNNAPEITMELESKNSTILTTPKASWYLTIEDYKKMFKLIKTAIDFRKVDLCLVDIKSEADASKIKKIGLENIIK